MRSLFLKEITSFFSSITGYLVIIVFLVINGLFLWVFPGEMNVLDAGYSSLETLFVIAPWVFLLLVPAITMRSIAEEKKTGNMELLLTRPLNDLQIILAKYLASFVLTMVSVILTLIFYYSVIKLGSPLGNIDHGGTWGSYFGLLFLAASYVSIGIFASSLSDNIIVSFILSVLLCFLLYMGLNSISDLIFSGTTGNILLNLGIDAHYHSLQRGVIDSRDLIYFFSIIILFILFTRIKMNSRKW
jgi:ABC-2 type transport system permease protein